MRKCLLLAGCVLLSSCTQSVVELQPKFSQPVRQESKGFVCYTNIVLKDNRSRTLTYQKNLSTEAALEWFESAFQAMTRNKLNFVAAPSDGEPILEISLDYAYISHAFTNKVGVVAFTASKAGRRAHFRGNSSKANWANTKSELSAALNRAVSQALTKLADSEAFCDSRPAIWRQHDRSSPSI